MSHPTFNDSGIAIVPRYRLYREHKFVTYTLSEFSRTVSKSDFSLTEEIQKIKDKLDDMIDLIKGHAEHEDNHIHALLRKKGSLVYEKIEQDHAGHADLFNQLGQLLNQAILSSDRATRIEYGYQFYLKFQKFEAHNLLHQIYEESVIMPELQCLYTDEELLSGVDAKTYEAMTVEEMIDMISVLFSHFNADDREAFLKDIKMSQPEKFKLVWKNIGVLITDSERAQLRVQWDLD